MAIIFAIPAIKGSSTKTISYACHGKNQPNTPDLKVCPDTAAEIAYVTNDEKVAYVSGINCTPETAADQFIATRRLFQKDTGTKCYHFIQSFKPGEVDPEIAHKIGRKLCEKFAPGYEIVIGTHIDKAHIHNHFAINSVNKDFGYKYNSNKRQLQLMKDESDALCKRYNLSVIEKKGRRPKTSMAEIQLTKKGVTPWKDLLKDNINDAITSTNNKEDFIRYLKDIFQIDVKWQNVNISFLYPGKQKYVRGDTLSEAFKKDNLVKLIYDRSALPVKDETVVQKEMRESKREKSKHQTEPERYKRYCEKNGIIPEKYESDIVLPKVIDIGDLGELRRTDLRTFLEERGYDIELQKNGSYRVNDLSGVYINSNGRRWESNLFHRGGNAIDFLMRFERMSYEDAVYILQGIDDIVKYDLPDQAESNDHIRNYLVNELEINKDLFDELASKGLIYEAKGTKNCVFASFDDDGNVHGGYETYNNRSYNAGHYCAISNSENDFHISGNTDTLYVYADPLEVLKQESVQIKFDVQEKGHKLFSRRNEAVLKYIGDHDITKVITLDKNSNIIREMTAEDECKILNALIGAKKISLAKYLKENSYTIYESENMYYDVKEINGLKVNYVKVNYINEKNKEVIYDKLLNTWYDENRDKEGSTIKLLTDYEKYTYWEAIEKLSGIKTVFTYNNPRRALNNENIKAYFNGIGIYGARLEKLLNTGLVYQSVNNEVVFNFIDKNGKIRGGYSIDLTSDDKQGQYIEKSNMNYSFNLVGTCNKIIVFKNAEDLLKVYTSDKYNGEHLILSNRDSALSTYLDDHSGIDTIEYFNEKPEKIRTITAELEKKIFQAYKKAKETSLYAYLIENGYNLDYIDGKYKIKGNNDIYIRDDKWYSEEKNVIAGNTLSFVMKYEGYNFRESISIATNNKEIYPLIMPNKSENNDRLLKYLVINNGLNKDLVKKLITSGMVYENSAGNVVYVRMDSKGYVRSLYEQEMKISRPEGKFISGSNYNYGFAISGNTQRVLVFRDHQQLLKYENEEQRLNREHGTDLADHKIIAFNDSTIERYLDDNKDVKEVKVIEPERKVTIDRTFDRISALLKIFGGNDYKREAHIRFLEMLGKIKNKDKDEIQKYMES